MALACEPDLLVLDEPTTGLDVTTQEQIIELLADLRARLGMSMLYVTHDLGVLAEIADRVGVMYAGQLVEIAPTGVSSPEPRHPYTRGLIASIPRLDAAPRRSESPCAACCAGTSSRPAARSSRAATSPSRLRQQPRSGPRRSRPAMPSPAERWREIGPPALGSGRGRSGRGRTRPPPSPCSHWRT